jgi:dihydroorotase
MSKYDLLIKKGHVIDPAQGIDRVMDVALAGGKVAAVADALPEADAAELLDAEGMIVTPGLIDLHVHNYWGANEYGIEPDATNLAKGVTTALDAGSAGSTNFAAFRRFIMEPAATRLLALINISRIGLVSKDIGELTDMDLADAEAAARVARENRDLVLGIKARLSEPITKGNDVGAVKRALEAAEAMGGFLMIHVGNTVTPMEELVGLLRPGDVVTHAYHGTRHGILDDAGKVIAGMWEAQRRGVVFDIGHGAGSFSFRVAERALADGFYPGNISSDLHAYNVHGPVHDHVTILSRFLHLGLSLYDTIRLTTQSTAEVMGLAGRLGTLTPGAEGDVTILKIEEGRFDLTDSYGITVTADKRLTHVHTVRAGRQYHSP